VPSYSGSTSQAPFFDCLTLKMEAVRSLETPVATYQCTRRNAPDVFRNCSNKTVRTSYIANNFSLKGTTRLHMGVMCCERVAGIKYPYVIYTNFSQSSPLLSIDLIQGSTCSLISERIKYTFLVFTSIVNRFLKYLRLTKM
jgi:hypothetical protein